MNIQHTKEIRVRRSTAGKKRKSRVPFVLTLKCITECLQDSTSDPAPSETPPTTPCGIEAQKKYRHYVDEEK